jgi:hypothetical protein
MKNGVQCQEEEPEPNRPISNVTGKVIKLRKPSESFLAA